METKKFKREDAIELTEENVVRIYQDCLATPDTEKFDRGRFIYSEKMPEIIFDYNKIISNRK